MLGRVERWEDLGMIGPGPRNQVRPAGFEPATRCLEGTVEASRCVAWCRSMSHLTARMRAGCGLALPGGCGCWLPVWLPDLSDFACVRMSENASAGPHVCGGTRWECAVSGLSGGEGEVPLHEGHDG